MELRLDGKVAVITGATKNVGWAISRRFAEAGAELILVARGSELLEQRASELRATGAAKVTTVVADVGTIVGTQRIVETADAEHGPVDVLVNNALHPGAVKPFFDVTDDEWDAPVAVNLVGPFRLCRDFGSRMIAGSGGSIINVLSGSGFQHTPNVTPYGATKAGLWMLTRYLAAEGAPKVRANALVPGMIHDDTAGWTRGQGPSAVLEARTPMGRMGSPEEVAPAALYLASDASSFTTGTVLFVNGGRPW